MLDFALKRCALLVAAGLVFCELFCEKPALANGRFPATNAVVAQPGNPKTIALRATYGLLLSRDEGANWDWICESAIGYSGNEDPSVVLTGSGAMIVGTFSGTSRSVDGGCHWSHDPSWPTNVIDLTTRPRSPERIHAVTNSFSKMGDAGTNLYASQVFISEDAGASWSARSTLDPTLLIDSIEVAPSDPMRTYVSAVRASEHATRGVLLVSSDDGAHWKELEIKLITPEHGVYIAAVDPENPARIYVRTASADASRLLVSNDAGTSFREIASGGLLRGFALADNGVTIFAGDSSGLSRASSKDDHFDHVSSTSVQCLTSIGLSLWACAPTSAGYVVGASTDRGATFAPKLALGGMRGELQCAAPSSMDICAADWSALQSLINPNAAADASVSPTTSATASTERASRSAGEKRSMFSCALRGAERDDDPPVSLFAFCALVFFARRMQRKNHAAE
ncbi:MAG: hypothetical protein ABI183_03825 [Polyangiaceae bacterium]